MTQKASNSTRLKPHLTVKIPLPSINNPISLPALLSASILLAASVHADEFQDMADSFGTTLTLAGVHHEVTSNPDGSAINFWTPDFEGAEATTVGLSNPHMAGADAYGNIYIADKSGQAVLRITTDGLIHTFAGTHEGGFNGDGPAPATSLQISNVNGLFVFPNGTVYLLDPGNHRIRRVGTDGMMTTVVNDPEPEWYPSGRALWVSPDEQLIYYTHEFQPVPPSIIADGAVLKRWTSTNGIETVCSRDAGFRNPANIAVNPVDGKLYMCDRAEDDLTKIATGLFRIDGPDQPTRITGNITQPLAADGQLAINSYIDGPRGIAFRPNGSYFLCGHKDGNVWFVDTEGVLHKYLRGSGRRDGFNLPDGQHPPLIDNDYFAQPRSVTLAPNGSLLVVCNDSGFVFQVNSVRVPASLADLRLTARGTNGVRLNWTGVFGCGYRVERTFNLGDSSWRAVGAVGGNPAGTTEFIDAEPAIHPFSAYRVLPSL
jgi:DNA-binding beta-propeller fold protein YncE